jgi:DNA polymerase III subunit epsilon
MRMPITFSQWNLVSFLPEKKMNKQKSTRNRQPELLRFKRFAAIDFETADYGRDSACAIAAVVVDSGKIIYKGCSLIRPPRRNFIFSYLHGITWEDVAMQPSFKEFWPKLMPLFMGVDFIAAHNASFDRSVLYTCCNEAGIKPPDHGFLCTMRLARRLWNLRPTKLPDVCRHLNISLQHHDAASDALACASIVLETVDKGVPISAMLKKS